MRTTLPIAVYCVAAPFGLVLLLFFLGLLLQIGEAHDAAIVCALLWALSFLLGTISVAVGAAALVVYAWKGLRDNSRPRRPVVMRTLLTGAVMVAYFVVGLLLASVILKAVSGPRRPSRGIIDATGRKDPRIEEVLAFIERDPDAVHARDRTGYTPLHYASRPDRRELAELLIAHGADVDARSNAGDTPLHNAASEDRATDVARLLIARGAEINAANDEGDTALHLAARWACAENVHLLVAEGANLHSQNSAGDTPLDAAVRQWARQVDVWQRGAWNGTAESWDCSMREWEQCIEILQRNGARTTSTTWPQDRPRRFDSGSGR
jgi:hypothetical protein